MAGQAALPEQPDHLHRLGQALLADIGLRPVVAEDVLVQVLAAADAEEEPALEHGRGGGRRLGDDRGMDPRRRAGDAGADLDARVAWATPPSTAQTNGLLPCRSTQGW